MQGKSQFQRTTTPEWPFATPGIVRSCTSASPRSTTRSTRTRPPRRRRSRTTTASVPTSGACAAAATRYDEIFAEDEPRGRAGAAGSPTTNLRSVGARTNGDVRVHLVVPKSFNDAQQVADRFKDSIPVILNLQGTETDLAKRLIDFASGLTYALDGGMQRIADKVFMLTPRNVEISAEERARLIEKGFFNQS